MRGLGLGLGMILTPIVITPPAPPAGGDTIFGQAVTIYGFSFTVFGA